MGKNGLDAWQTLVHGLPFRSLGRRGFAVCQKLKVEEAMRVVEGRPKHLPPRKVLEGGGDPAMGRHARGIKRFGVAKAWQRGPIGPKHKDRFLQIPSRLLNRQRGEVPVIAGAFPHYPIYRKGKLLPKLLRGHLGHRVVAPTKGRQPLMGIFNGGFPALNGNISHSLSSFVNR